MKDLVAAFGPDVLRPIITLVAPGSVATLPWLVWLVCTTPALLGWINLHGTETAVIAVLIVLVAGQFCSDAGTYLEAMVFDKVADRRTGDRHSAQWLLFLRTHFDKPVAGLSHMNELVMFLQFEMGMMFAFLSAALALLLMPLAFDLRCNLFFLSLGGAGLTGWGAYNTHGTLSNLRSELLKGVTVLRTIQPL